MKKIVCIILVICLVMPVTCFASNTKYDYLEDMTVKDLKELRNAINSIIGQEVPEITEEPETAKDLNIINIWKSDGFINTGGKGRTDLTFYLSFFSDGTFVGFLNNDKRETIEKYWGTWKQYDPSISSSYELSFLILRNNEVIDDENTNLSSVGFGEEKLVCAIYTDQTRYLFNSSQISNK